MTTNKKTELKLFEVLSESHINTRLDTYLAKIEEIGSRSFVEKLIENQCVSVNEKKRKSSYRLQLKDKIEVLFPTTSHDTSELQPLSLNLDVKYEDSDLIVINKPAGLVVHPAAGHDNDTLVNALIARKTTLANSADPLRPGVVHRLDKDTSGLLVLAKSSEAYEHLVECFKKRSVLRTYWALVYGEPKEDSFTIKSYIARHPKHRKKFHSTQLANFENEQTASAQEEKGLGKLAISHFKKEFSRSGLTLLRVKLETGRTHQIRVHISEYGFPIVGDETYGGSTKRIKSLKSMKLRTMISSLNRFALHAAELGLEHPTTKKSLSFSSDWPDDLSELVKYWKDH